MIKWMLAFALLVVCTGCIKCTRTQRWYMDNTGNVSSEITYEERYWWNIKPPRGWDVTKAYTPRPRNKSLDDLLKELSLEWE